MCQSVLSQTDFNLTMPTLKALTVPPWSLFFYISQWSLLLYPPVALVMAKHNDLLGNHIL